MTMLRNADLAPEPGKSFEKCKLGREKYADVLTTIVRTYRNGFVMAINNPWGTGKTTFVRMWQQKLDDSRFKTLYFNAWENDFDANPLVALLAELKAIARTDDDNQFKSLVKKSAVIAKSVIPSVIRAMAKRYIDTEELLDAIEKTAEGAAEVLQEEVNEFATKKRGLADFRRQLKEYVAATAGDLPLIFIIDELDRCRPSYAVELLEQIKHFFTVPGIVFVMSIDKVQLSNAIKGFYGNGDIDTDEYLRRLIDVEYRLPVPDLGGYCQYLYESFDFNSFFEAETRRQNNFVRNDGRAFLDLAIRLAEANRLTLRQCEAFFSHSRIALRTFSVSDYVQPRPLLLLNFIRLKFPKLFESIGATAIDRQTFLLELRKAFPENIVEAEIKIYVSYEAEMLFLYNYSYFRRRPDEYQSRNLTREIAITDDTLSSSGRRYEPVVRSAVDKEGDGSILCAAIKRLEETYFHFDNLGTDPLVNRIALLQEIVSEN